MKKLLLILVIAIFVGCEQEKDCKCELVTYETWNDGTLDHWKVYSSVPVQCTNGLDVTEVKELENGHTLKMFIECE